MRKEFVMRGMTPSGSTEVLNFSGFKPGVAYRLTEFSIYPATAPGGSGIGSANYEMCASLTASKTAMDPELPNFNDEGLIGTALFTLGDVTGRGPGEYNVVNDTFLITQNLLLKVHEVTDEEVNWQCRFEAVKMSGPEEAVTNYKQFAISDE